MKNIYTTLIGLFISVCSFGQIGTITGPASSCTDSSLTLSDATPGGTWSCGSPAIATVGSTTGIVTGVSAGVAVITYTVGAGNVTALVTVNPAPAAYIVTGGGSFCAGGTGVHIGLSYSDAGINYQLWNGGPVGVPVAGTNSGLDFGLLTAPGTYTVTATNPTTGCTSNMTGTANVAINPLPTAYTLSGGVSGCTASHIILSGSDLGTTYQLFTGGIAVGSPVAGSGSSVDFGLGTFTGIYTATSTNGATGCTRAMSGSATVSIPVGIFDVIGGGGFCTGGTGVHIGLDFSGSGVNYQLMRGSTAVLSPFAGTGGPIDFGLFTTNGIYKVIATNPSTGCTDTMADSAVITSGVTPTVYTVTGGGSSCGATSHIYLSGSQTGVSYQLYMGTTTVGTPVAGTGAALDFGVQTINGTYTASANSFGCYNAMSGSATIITDPVVYSITGGGLFCTGGPGVHIGLASSQAAIIYSLYLGTALVSTLTGTGAALDFGLQTATGAYHITANNSYSGCTDTMAGTATIATGTPPPSFTVTGGGGSCPGSAIYLSGSTYLATYEVFRDGSSTGTTVAGSGGSIYLGYFTTPGLYTVTATIGSGCTLTMTGSATITATGVTTFNLNGGGAYCSGPAPHIYLSGSQTGVLYKLYDMYNNLVDTITGTGSALDFGAYTAPGFYRATSLNTTTGCGVSMNGQAKIEPAPGTCSGVPYAGDASTNDWPPLCAGKSLSLFLSGVVLCGTTYQWQSSPNSTTWTNIPGATGFSYTHTPTASFYYRCVVTCTSSGLSANSGYIFIKINNRISYYGGYTPGSCGSPHFQLNTCSADTSYHVRTWFGDGTSGYDHVSSYTTGYLDVTHTYALPGTYLIKQVLYDTTGPVDSISYSFENIYCKILSLAFYNDTNSNCIKDAGELATNFPIRIAIDTNGIPLDTLTGTSGLYYYASGGPGTVYGFRSVAFPGMHTTCPSSGVIYDTIQSTVDVYPTKYFALECDATSATDLAIKQWSWASSHELWGGIYITNTYCNPAPAVVTMHFSPHYTFRNAYPTPTSIVGNTVTWNLGSIHSASEYIYFNCDIPGSGWLIPGTDTVHADYKVAVVSSETDTTNNYVATVSGVYGPYDPNEMSVSPATNVIPCTPLHYTINFENTGNDIAKNIFVVDTLSDNLDPKTLQVEFASAQMNTGIYKAGSHYIAKFDFPHINLLDSSHHGKADGMVRYTIKTKPGLADGALIKNTAGIFFDDNPAVLTNTAVNVLGVSATNGQPTVCVGSHDTLSNNTAGGVWSVTNAHASIALVPGGCIVTGVTAGLDTIKYTVANSCTTRTVNKIVTINAAPSIGGTANVCMGSTATLSDPTTGGTWSNTNTSVSTISPSSGVVTAVAAGVDTIIYTIASGCKATKSITVSALPTVYTVTGGGSFCAGDTGAHVMLSESDAGVSYQLRLGSTSVGSAVAGTGSTLNLGVVTTGGTYTAIATNTTSGCSNNMLAGAVVNVNPLPAAYTVTGGGGYCVGDTGVHIRLSGSATGINYQLFSGGPVGGVVAGTGSLLDMGLQTTAGTYTIIATNPGTTCSRNMTSSASITINPLPTTFTVTGGGGYCAGDTGVHIYLSGSGAGIHYQLYHSGSPDGSALTGGGTALDFGVHTLAGTYTVVGTNPSTSCKSTMTSSVVININPLPSTYTVSGGGSFCADDTGRHIFLSGSATGINYQLYKGGVAVGGTTAGTGSGLDMGLYAAPGVYTVRAKNTITSCLSNMPGSAIMTVIPTVAPSVSIAVPGGNTICNGTLSGFTASSVNGGSAPDYLWKVNGVVSGTGSSYSYTPANGDVVKARLRSNTVCPGPDTAIASVVMTVIPLNIPFVAITANPGFTLTPGQTVTLTAGVTNCSSAPSFQWIINTTPVPGATNSIYITNMLYDNDSVTCQVSCSGLCGHEGFNSVRINVNSTGIKDPGGFMGMVGIYPNPNKGVFTIKGKTGLLNDEEMDVTLTDLLGQVVYAKKMMVHSGAIDEQVVCEHTLARGVYLLNLKGGEGVRVFRVLVE